MGQGQGTYEGKSRGVEVITGYAWDKSREIMKARAGKRRQRQGSRGNDRVNVGQWQGTYEGKSREVEATTGRIWDKGRAHVGKGKNRVVKGMTNVKYMGATGKAAHMY